MATLKSRVLQILGENNSTYLDAIPNAEIIFEDAVWDMVSSLPRRFLSATATEPVDPENIPLDSGVPTYQNTQASPVNVKDKLILNVLRTESDYTLDGETITEYKYITRPAKEIGFEQSYRAKDSSSIYYATALSPVYWIENVSSVPYLNCAPSASGSTDAQYLATSNGSALQIFSYQRQVFYPTETSATAWADGEQYVVGDIVSAGSKNWYCIEAHSSDNGGSDNVKDPSTVSVTTGWALCWDFQEDIVGIDKEAYELIMHRIALKVLEHKLGTLATQDEDSEVYNLVKDLHNTLGGIIGQIVQNYQREEENK
tara:strand:+ start:1143 stop:2084 length:942 start_codon:yes stop_codon:yes gene_type:complete